MKDGGKAFPRDTKWLLDGTEAQVGSGGMSLRDYFAAAALMSYRAEGPGEWCCAPIASDCYRMADAMLAAREAPL